MTTARGLMFFRHCWPGLLWTLVILVLTGLPGDVFPKVASWLEILEPDKIIHLAIFSIFVMSWSAGLYTYLPGDKRGLVMFYALLMGIFYSGLTEILQKYVFIGRYASLYDYLADVAGCLAGLALLVLLRKWKIELPFLSFPKDSVTNKTKYTDF